MAASEDIVIRFADAQVTRVCVDYAAVMLLIGSADESLELYIETALELVRHDSCVVLDPQSDDARVGELFALRRAGFRECTAGGDGVLRIEFEDDARIVVAPHPDYQAWELSHSGHVHVVAMPGGDLAIWDL